MDNFENQEKPTAIRERIGRSLLILPLFIGLAMIWFAWQFEIHNALFVVVALGFIALGVFLYGFYETI